MDSAGAARWSGDLIEVRLLGPLHVRRRNGELVDHREWRTGMTADLLRVLAMSDGRPVAVDVLLDELWPGVDASRGRASLRTAVSHLRQVLGQDAVERQAAGLVLSGGWVDVAVYERLALDAQRLLRVSDPAAVVRTALEAEALRLGEITAYETGAGWVRRAHAQHQAVRLQLLLGAAGAALELGWLADAADLASRAIEQDPTCEPATRTLMQAHARLGAGASALQEFERCRLVLAEELGVDPSPQTRALHLGLLQGPDPHLQELAPAVRRRETSWLGGLLAGMRTTAAALTIHLSGDTAEGRLALVDDVCTEGGVPLLTAPDLVAGLDQVRARREGGPDEVGVQVLYVAGTGPARGAPTQPDGQPSPGRAAAGGHRGLPDGLVLVLSAQEHRVSPTGLGLHLHPLLREELTELAEQVLGDTPGDLLLTELALAAAGSHTRAVATLQQWLREGRVLASASGMLLLDGDTQANRVALRTRLTRTAERLTTLDLRVLTTLAVLDRPTSRDQLLPLLSDDSALQPGDASLHPGDDGIGSGGDAGLPPGDDARLDRSLDLLLDLGLLGTGDGRLVLRDALLADGVRSWLRPSVLRGLHRTVAERALIPSAERVGHWIAVGMPELACAAALEAADEAVADGRLEEARTHLLQVCALADVQVDLSADGVGLSEQLADVLRQLGRPDEAQRAVRSTCAPVASSVRQLPVTVLGTRAALPARPPRPDEGQGGSVPARPALAPERRGTRQDEHLPADALPRLARHDGPAPALAGALVELLLGNTVHAERGLLQLRAELDGRLDPDLEACLELLLRVAAHDLGKDLGPASWQGMDALARTAGPDWSWAPVRVLAERHDLAAAAAADARPPGGPRSVLAEQLQGLAQSALSQAGGDLDSAVAVLQDVVQSGLESGCSLLLPECASRLALLEAPRCAAAAKDGFDLFEWAVGAQDARPRATVLRLLARGALRMAAGEHLRAAAASGQAAHVAQASQLVPLAAHALLERSRQLAAGGSAEAMTALALARGAFRGAGLEPHPWLGVAAEAVPPGTVAERGAARRRLDGGRSEAG